MINTRIRRCLYLIIVVGLCLLLVIGAVACSEPSPVQVPPSSHVAEQSSDYLVASKDLPVIADFSADRTEVTDGSLVTLLWTIEGATEVSIDQSVGEVALGGGVAVRPHTTTTYTLTATNAAGTVSKSMVINVNELPSSPPPPPPPCTPPCTPSSPPTCPSCH